MVFVNLSLDFLVIHHEVLLIYMINSYYCIYILGQLFVELSKTSSQDSSDEICETTNAKKKWLVFQSVITSRWLFGRSEGNVDSLAGWKWFNDTEAEFPVEAGVFYDFTGLSAAPGATMASSRRGIVFLRSFPLGPSRISHSTPPFCEKVPQP